MFKSYISKPITREAFQISPEMMICKMESEATFCAVGDGFQVNFKAYEVPVVGDWVVRLTEEDTYHVRDDVFRERNIVD